MYHLFCQILVTCVVSRVSTTLTELFSGYWCRFYLAQNGSSSFLLKFIFSTSLKHWNREDESLLIIALIKIQGDPVLFFAVIDPIEEEYIFFCVCQLFQSFTKFEKALYSSSFVVLFSLFFSSKIRYHKQTSEGFE